MQVCIRLNSVINKLFFYIAIAFYKRGMLTEIHCTYIESDDDFFIDRPSVFFIIFFLSKADCIHIYIF